MIGLVVRIAALFGFKASPFIAGAIVAGVGLVLLGSALLMARNAGKEACELKHAREAIAERDRQAREVNEIQLRDADAARLDADAARKHQEAINATPANDRVCFDRDAARRVRDVR